MFRHALVATNSRDGLARETRRTPERSSTSCSTPPLPLRRGRLSSIEPKDVTHHATDGSVGGGGAPVRTIDDDEVAALAAATAAAACRDSGILLVVSSAASHHRRSSRSSGTAAHYRAVAAAAAAARCDIGTSSGGLLPPFIVEAFCSSGASTCAASAFG